MIIRDELARPYFTRNSIILNLNGIWDFDFDDNNIGHKEKWFLEHKFLKKINVPFPFQSKLSGIEDTTFHDFMWYKKEINLELDKNKKYILNFNGVDYYSEIYINGIMIFTHLGSGSRFKVDISDYVINGNNIIALFIKDESTRQDFPRGKQYWKENSESIFYNRTSGIYKNVYLEIIDNDTYLDEIYISSDIDKGEISIESIFSSKNVKRVEYLIKLKDKILNQVSILNPTFDTRLVSKVSVWNYINDILSDDFHNDDLCWSPTHPILYDLNIKLFNKKNELVDEVSTYFSMRKVSTLNGMFYLNNRPFTQKLVLIQGYFKDGLLTYPSIKDLEKDILLAKEMGFNGGRMHQKIEDPYYYYLCDKLGFIAWLECPSAQIFTKDLVVNQAKEWMDIVKQNYNHPSITTLVPLNESWGVPNLPFNILEENFQNALYYLTKSIDNSRIVVGNDGWEISMSDICSIHNYNHGRIDDLVTQNNFKLSLKDKESLITSAPSGRAIFLNGYEDISLPILLTEFGGISFTNNKSGDWGYTSVNTKEEYFNELKRIMLDIASSTGLAGYCYTQLYDVEQEINGLLTYDREIKIDLNKIKELNDLIPERMFIVK